MEQNSQTLDKQKWNNESLDRAGINIQSNSQYAVCPPAALSSTVHLILMD